MTPTQAVLGALAAHRLTKLVIDDEIIRELREKAYDELDKHRDSVIAQKLTYLLSCPWCVSIYAAAALSALYIFAPKTYNVVAASLGFSSATGLLFENL